MYQQPPTLQQRLFCEPAALPFSNMKPLKEQIENLNSAQQKPMSERERRLLLREMERKKRLAGINTNSTPYGKIQENQPEAVGNTPPNNEMPPVEIPEKLRMSEKENEQISINSNIPQEIHENFEKPILPQENPVNNQKMAENEKKITGLKLLDEAFEREKQRKAKELEIMRAEYLQTQNKRPVQSRGQIADNSYTNLILPSNEINSADQKRKNQQKYASELDSQQKMKKMADDVFQEISKKVRSRESTILPEVPNPFEQNLTMMRVKSAIPESCEMQKNEINFAKYPNIESKEIPNDLQKKKKEEYRIFLEQQMRENSEKKKFLSHQNDESIRESQTNCENNIPLQRAMSVIPVSIPLSNDFVKEISPMNINNEIPMSTDLANKKKEEYRLFLEQQMKEKNNKKKKINEQNEEILVVKNEENQVQNQVSEKNKQNEDKKEKQRKLQEELKKQIEEREKLRQLQKQKEREERDKEELRIIKEKEELLAKQNSEKLAEKNAKPRQLTEQEKKFFKPSEDNSLVIAQKNPLEIEPKNKANLFSAQKSDPFINIIENPNKPLEIPEKEINEQNFIYQNMAPNNISEAQGAQNGQNIDEYKKQIDLLKAEKLLAKEEALMYREKLTREKEMQMEEIMKGRWTTAQTIEPTGNINNHMGINMDPFSDANRTTYAPNTYPLPNAFCPMRPLYQDPPMIPLVNHEIFEQSLASDIKWVQVNEPMQQNANVLPEQNDLYKTWNPNNQIMPTLNNQIPIILPTNESEIKITQTPSQAILSPNNKKTAEIALQTTVLEPVIIKTPQSEKPEPVEKPKTIEKRNLSTFSPENKNEPDPDSIFIGFFIVFL